MTSAKIRLLLGALRDLIAGYSKLSSASVECRREIFGRTNFHLRVVSLGINVYPIHTEIFAPKINEINFIPVRDCWLLIGRTVFVTSEKYRPTNHRPRTALCH